MIVNTYNKNKHEIAESHPINEEIKKSKSKMLPQKCLVQKAEGGSICLSVPSPIQLVPNISFMIIQPNVYGYTINKCACLIHILHSKII